MKEFKDKVAVITGAVSGIGKALAEKAAQEGMKVVLADIEDKAIKRTIRKFKKLNSEVLAVKTDVSKREDIENLAKKTLDTYGKVDLLINNAGVAVPGVLQKLTPEDWEWILGVNVWGVINGIQVFLPIMDKQDEESRIINTASISGILPGRPGNAPYSATKSAIVAITESLYHELKFLDSKVKVSLLCPSFVKTRIINSGRNRPENLKNETELTADGIMNMIPNPIFKEAATSYLKDLASGMPPEKVADDVFEGIKEDKFYIITGSKVDFKYYFNVRADDIFRDGMPTFIDLQKK